MTLRHGDLSLSFYDTYLHKRVHLQVPGHSLKVTIQGLGVTAYVNPHSETSWHQGGPGDRVMLAYWYAGAHLIEMRASVPDFAAFRERLGWLRSAGAEEWLDAMPARVVKAADYAATVESMLAGIPLPSGFDPSRLQTEGITTDRYQVGAAVGGAVACGWFRIWGEAVEAGDSATVKKAEAVLMRWKLADLPRNGEGRRLPGDDCRNTRKRCRGARVRQAAAARGRRRARCGTI